MGERADARGKPIILLIDGDCNLCHGITRFVIKRDPKGVFRFASLQSNYGRKMLKAGGMPEEGHDTFVMIDNGRYYTKSTAALRTFRRLTGLWPLLCIGIILPPFVRNGIYDFIARRRYRWFGRQDFCLLPTPGIRERLIEEAVERGEV